MVCGILSIISLIGVFLSITAASTLSITLIFIVAYIVFGCITMHGLLAKEKKRVIDYLFFAICLPCYIPITIIRGEREKDYIGISDTRTEIDKNVDKWKVEEPETSFFEKAENFFSHCESYLDGMTESSSYSDSSSDNSDGIYKMFPNGERYSTAKYKLKFGVTYVEVYEPSGSKILYDFPIGRYDADHNIVDNNGNVYKKI